MKEMKEMSVLSTIVGVDEAMKRLDGIIERLGRSLKLARLEVIIDNCEQLRSMVRRAADRPNVDSVLAMLLGDLYSLWGNWDDVVEGDFDPSRYGRNEVVRWKAFVGTRRRPRLSKLLEKRVGNCLSWTLSTVIVLLASGHVSEAYICEKPWHLWARVLMPNGRWRNIDLATRAHGRPQGRLKAVKTIKV